MQKIGGLRGVGAGGGEVAAVQLGRGEIDQDQDALPTRGRAELVECGGERLACAVVVTGLEQDVTGSGGQVRGGAIVKRRGGGAAGGLVEGGSRAVEGVARCGVLAPVCVDGGLSGGQPGGDGSGWTGRVRWLW